MGMLSVSGFELFHAARQAGGFASPPTANRAMVGIPIVHGYTAWYDMCSSVDFASSDGSMAGELPVFDEKVVQLALLLGLTIDGAAPPKQRSTQVHPSCNTDRAIAEPLASFFGGRIALLVELAV
jgi:hypothetical protein